jgi:2-oxo-4-hydroxy-4-carboxy-5-ureidoimidazoline decarboxylase
MTLEALNAMDQDAFIASLGWIFEGSPWVAERAWASRPFSDWNALHRAMVCEVQSAAFDEQLALLRAHPDLGTRARLSDASASEQAGASLDQLTHDEFDLFNRLNTSYKEKFGFPFLFAVKGSSKHGILQALEHRLPSTYEDEFAEALRQVYRIAEFRLKD